MKNRKILTFLLMWAIACLIGDAATAQTDSAKSRILVGEPGRTLVKESESGGLVMKTSLYRWLRGELPLLFEFPIGKNVHLELGPSITYFDYGFFLWAEGVVLREEGPLNRHDQSIMTFQGARVGFGFTTQLKYFFEKDDLFSGKGIGLYMNSRRHRYDFAPVFTSFNPGLVRVRELALMYITQDHYQGIKEVNIGLGLNMHYMDYVKYDDSGGTVIYSPGTIRLIKPALFYNFKFGLALFTR